MNETFATLIHAAPKLEVDELMTVRKQFAGLLGKEFVDQADTDKSCINKVVAENIDMQVPDPGQTIYRLCQLAKERNIEYTPSHESSAQLNSYCDRTGKPHPLGASVPQPVQYQPQQLNVPIQPVVDFN
jgi:hypothetical protein